MPIGSSIIFALLGKATLHESDLDAYLSFDWFGYCFLSFNSLLNSYPVKVYNKDSIEAKKS